MCDRLLGGGSSIVAQRIPHGNLNREIPASDKEVEVALVVDSHLAWQQYRKMSQVATRSRPVPVTLIG